MENTTPIGMNRTGLQMSPLSGGDMAQFAEAFAGDAPEDDGYGLTELHAEYVQEADRIGSVPIPGTLKGMASTGIAKLAGNNPEVLIDKLGERLAFERTGTRLYEALIMKCAAMSTTGDVTAGQQTDGMSVGASRGATIDLMMLKRIRDEEEGHFHLVHEAMESLGADPTAMTPCADVAGVMAQGLMQTITDPRTSIPQSLNAVLTAELSDNAGWELLIALANDLGHKDLAERFMGALEAEQEHLATVKAWLEKAVLVEAS